MPDPQISPTGVGNTTYTIQNSQAALVDLRLSIPFFAPFPSFEIRYPSGAASVQVTLIRGGVSLDLLPGPINDSATFTNRRVIASTFDNAGVSSLSCEIQLTGGPTSTDNLTLRIVGLAGGQCDVVQNDNTPGTP